MNRMWQMSSAKERAREDTVVIDTDKITNSGCSLFLQSSYGSFDVFLKLLQNFYLLKNAKNRLFVHKTL